jgi:hypothetical protein
MWKSPNRRPSDDSDHPFRLVPERSGRLYRTVSFVRGFLNISGGGGAASNETPAKTSQSAAEETAAAAPSSLHGRPHRATAEHTQPDDAQVRVWKRTWVTGAESQWAGTSLKANPHKSDSQRAAAWRAGWHWAESQPDRREPDQVRFAHGHRRSTDRSALLVRRAQAGAVGLSILTVAGWLWQIRRQRTRGQREE